MTPLFNIAASGLADTSARAKTVASNIVNTMTAGRPDPGGALLASETLSAIRAYQPRQHVATSLPSGGVRSQTIPRTPATFLLYDPANPAADDAGMAAYPNVSLEHEIVELKMAAHAYKANAHIIKTADEMLGALLNRRS